MVRPTDVRFEPQLILYFSSPSAAVGDAVFKGLRAGFPGAHIIGCTTGGHFAGATIADEDAVAAAIRFADARVR
ncbi:MAG: FIST N-terminal domain-containing protein, partial [Alphaproteobacteria bacterium]